MGGFDTIDDAVKVRERAREACLDVLMQELEPGLTFCRIALADHSEHLAQQHRGDADKAYRTALRFVDAQGADRRRAQTLLRERT